MLFAHFVNKLREASRIGEIQDCAGLDAVAITAADHRLIPLLSEFQHGPVFFPASQPTQFESMHEVPELCDKIGERLYVVLPANSREIPHGVIQNDQHVRVVVERRKKIRKSLFHRSPGIFRQLRHNAFRAIARQIVNPQVQCRISVRNTPFDRDRRTGRLGDDAQGQWRFDTVVVCQRDHAG